MEIFSTREIVSFIYISIFIFFALLHKKIRISLIEVIKAACTPKLAIPFVLMLLYACIIIGVLCKSSLWDWIFIKDIIIWVLFAGVPVCFNAVRTKIEEHYFRHMLTDNLKFTALVEFFTGTFTFCFLAELIIQPVIAFFILLQIVSNTKKDYNTINRLLNWIIAILGFVILGFTIKTAINEYKKVNSMQTIISFCLPLFLSLLYLPFAHCFAVYAKYEILFIRMGFKEPHNKKLRLMHRLKVISVCKLSYKKICEFTNNYIKNMYVTMNETDFDIIISNFKNAYK
ncbi:MAG TPA: hypothetical protein PK321_10395 [Clostridia bacterium]|jgi:hypothetical protein|nr:hypothetical protein [Clostridia bacterium]